LLLLGCGSFADQASSAAASAYHLLLLLLCQYTAAGS
jgi:hypothetical protein